MINPQVSNEQVFVQVSFQQHNYIEDYAFLSVLGIGSFAKVVLAKSRLDGKLYAVKIIHKQKVIRSGFCEHTLTQKAIMSCISHPFLTKMHSSFQDPKHLYLVMDYCPGGELFSMLDMKGRFSEDIAKFYTCQIVTALDKLHEKNVIYRDLKPENILMDRQGNLKLTDFGLSKALLEPEKLTNTICGTPQYFAPEMINQTGHGITLDWWELGCLIYEMTVGLPPFTNPNRNLLFDEIKYKCPHFPTFLSAELRDLLKKLLQKDPKERLGSKGVNEIKSHSWFKGVRWNTIERKQIRPPYIPQLDFEEDVSNFSQEFTNCSFEQIYEECLEEKDEVQDINFPGFEYNTSY